MLNFDEYNKQRNSAISEAEQALADGDMELFNSLTEEVKTMDKKFEEQAAAQADMEALKGAAKAPVAVAETMGMVDDMSERKAFMNYVLRNADAQTTSSDAGAAIPKYLVDRIVAKIEETGVILAKVTKTYYKGGVTVPVAAAKPSASWVAERGTADTQKVDLTGSVTFSYYKLKVTVALSLVVENLTIDAFETFIVNAISEAMVKAIDTAIVAGTGSSNNQPQGIKTVTPVNGQAISSATITYAKLLEMEAALPSGYDNSAEYFFNKKTFFTSVLGLVDSTGQPIARVDAGIAGKPAYTLFGRPVNFTDGLDALSANLGNSKVYGFLFTPADYMFNSALNIKISSYVDEATDDTNHKAIMLADGKVIDKNSLVTLSTPAAG